MGINKGASPRSVCFSHIGSSRKDDPLRCNRGLVELLAVDAVEKRELMDESSSTDAALPIICNDSCDY